MTDVATVSHEKYYRPQRVSVEEQKYTYEDRMTALAVYAETNSYTTAEKRTGIPQTTIRSWVVNNEDSDAILADLRYAIKTHVAFKCAEAASKAMDAVLERLENGDEVLDSEGNPRRRKVSAKDAQFIANSCVDKHSLLVGSATEQREVSKALISLAGKLMQAKAQGEDKVAKQSHKKPVDNLGPTTIGSGPEDENAEKHGV